MSEIIKMPQMPGAEPSPQNQEEIVKQIQMRIMNMARQLWNMIPPGGTIVCQIPLQGNIVVPGQQEEFGMITISKATMFDMIQGRRA